MPRTTDASVQTKLSKQTITYFDCVEIFTQQNGVERVYLNTTAMRDITINVDGVNKTFKPAGNLISIDNISENTSFEIQKVSIGFNALAQNDGFGNPVLSTFMSDTTVYIDQKVRIFRVFLEADGTVDNYIEIFNGTIDELRIATSNTEERSLSIVSSSHWADFSRVNSNRTNTNSQNKRSFMAGQTQDLGMEYSVETMKDIEWKE